MMLDYCLRRSNGQPKLTRS